MGTSAFIVRKGRNSTLYGCVLQKVGLKRRISSTAESTLSRERLKLLYASSCRHLRLRPVDVLVEEEHGSLGITGGQPKELGSGVIADIVNAGGDVGAIAAAVADGERGSVRVGDVLYEPPLITGRLALRCVHRRIRPVLPVRGSVVFVCCV